MGNLLGGWRFKEPSTVEECDSTWDTDSEGEERAEEEPQEPACNQEPPAKARRSFYAAKDLYKYRHRYPSYKEPRMSEFRNLRFYLNKVPLVPDGVYIEEILTQWRGDYEKLENNHTYIQWLFPLREQGLNFYAQELTQDEIKEFQGSREARRRFLQAYTLMLDFYGIKLLDKSGNVSRSSKWQDRFQHLNESQHNYLRITRILKSLGELGFEAFKMPLVRLLLEEALVTSTLPNMRHSALEYFVYTLRDRAQRRALLRFAQHHYVPPQDFVWGPQQRRKVCGGGARPGKGEPARNLTSLHAECKEAAEERGMCEKRRSDQQPAGGKSKSTSSVRPLRGAGEWLQCTDTIPL
ncbi:opioid growth factor receptor-like protein 1 isoform X2 [Arapaima gigas]